MLGKIIGCGLLGTIGNPSGDHVRRETVGVSLKDKRTDSLDFSGKGGGVCLLLFRCTVSGGFNKSGGKVGLSTQLGKGLEREVGIHVVRY